MSPVQFVACASLLIASSASAREPVRLSPVMPWNLRYEPESCQLVRAFGDEKNPTVLVMEQLGPNSSLSLMVFGAGLRSKMGDAPVSAAFLPFQANSFESAPVAETDTAKQTAIYWPYASFRTRSMTPRERKEREGATVRNLAVEASEKAEEQRVASAVTGLEIREFGRKTILETGPMGKAHAMMKDCTRDLLKGWGIDPAVQDRIVKRAKVLTPLTSVFRDSDYPADALRAGNESVIRARLLIDDKGTVTTCTSLSVYSTPGFADVVCRKLKQVRFSPAELADGTRVPDFTTTNIRFVMGRG